MSAWGKESDVLVPPASMSRRLTFSLHAWKTSLASSNFSRAAALVSCKKPYRIEAFKVGPQTKVLFRCTLEMGWHAWDGLADGKQLGCK